MISNTGKRTPEIIGAIRAGLVFQLKRLGYDTIYEREHQFVKRAINYWDEHPNIAILGNKNAWRLSIVSFMIRHGNGYLHHNAVVALLNDVFGIQARGGCSCAALTDTDCWGLCSRKHSSGRLFAVARESSPGGSG